MGSGRDVRNLFKQLQVLGMLAEFVVADQRAERRAAENAVLLLVNFLEQRALIEFRRSLEVAAAAPSC